MEIEMLDLFSGIGGFPLGFESAGFKIKTHFFSEINKHCIANYSHNFKHSNYAGSVTALSGRNLPKFDIINFGSPCQDFSNAGTRNGIGGQKSVLIKEAIRLVTEIRPGFFIWENVAGAFSTNNGADFWAIIQAFTNIGGYSIEWQLLDTLWLLPQSRKRIYLIGHLTEPGRRFRPVFPITEKEIKNTTGNSRENLKVMQLNPTKEFHNGPRQQNRVFATEGAMCTLNLKGDNGLIRCISGQPRTGDKTKGGTGILYNDNGNAYCLSTSGSDSIISINDYDYRYLTEIERERLQGFPDDWTWYGNYNGVIKEIAKTNREAMTGNAVTVDIVKLIATKIKQNYYL